MQETIEQFLPLVFVLFGTLPFELLFLLLLISGLKNRRTVKQAPYWPRTRATIVESEAYEKQKRDRVKYKVRIKYTYEVNGVQHESRSLSFGARFSCKSLSEAQAIANRYPVGGQVDVIYDPRNPKHAALELGSEEASNTLVYISAGVLLLISGIWTVMLLNVLG